MGRLSVAAGSTTGELQAIRIGLIKAKEVIDSKPPHQKVNHLHIFSDSKTAWTVIQNKSQDDNQLILRDIDVLLRGLGDTETTFQWIPSHIGIEGNEKADELANEGGNASPGHLDDVPPSKSFLLARMRKVVRANFIERAHTESTREGSSRGLKRHLDFNPNCDPPKRGNVSRKAEVTINLLRSSHLTECVFRCGSKLTCEYCNNDFSAKHYMLECHPALRMALLQCVGVDTLQHGSEEDVMREILRNIHSVEGRIQEIVEFYPLQAKCENDHPIMKNYGMMIVSNPFKKTKFEHLQEAEAEKEVSQGES